MAASITFYIPGLFGPWQGNEQPGFSLPDLPAINSILSRSRHKSIPIPVETTDRSVAEYSYFADFGRWPDQAVLIVEPVHMRADQRHVRVYGSELLKPTPQESDALLVDLNAFMKQDGLQLESAAPDRWYLLLPDIASMSFSSLRSALGKPIDEYLPKGKDAAVWHRRLNEWQMLLFDHPVNQNRLSDKQLAINGVWLWGEQPLIAQFGLEYINVFSNEGTVTGFSMQSGMHVQPLPERLDQILPVSRENFVYLDSLERPLAYQDEQKWLSALSEIESNWLSPALSALKSSAVRQLVIETNCHGQRQQFSMYPKSHWRFWRKLSALQSWLIHD